MKAKIARILDAKPVLDPEGLDITAILFGREGLQIEKTEVGLDPGPDVKNV
jgi:hypothetical protein